MNLYDRWGRGPGERWVLSNWKRSICRNVSDRCNYWFLFLSFFRNFSIRFTQKQKTKNKNKKQKTRNKKQRRFVHSFVLAWVLEGSGRRVLSMKCKIHTVLCYKQCEIKTELRKREKQKQNKKKKTMPGQKDSRVTPSGLLLLSTQRFLKLVSFSPPPTTWVCVFIYNLITLYIYFCL